MNSLNGGSICAKNIFYLTFNLISFQKLKWIVVVTSLFFFEYSSSLNQKCVKMFNSNIKLYLPLLITILHFSMVSLLFSWNNYILFCLTRLSQQICKSFLQNFLQHLLQLYLYNNLMKAWKKILVLFSV